jgi:hypothetical protein
VVRLSRMIAALAVGGSVGPIGSSGWDAWPLVGIVVSLWISRRVLVIPWGAPIIIAALVSGLAFPPLVNAWGVIATFALTGGATVVALLVRTQRRPHPPGTV